MAQHKEGGGGAVDAQSCDRPLSNCRVSQARIFFSFSPLVSREHNVGRFEDKCGFVGCARRIFWASDVQGYILAPGGGGHYSRLCIPLPQTTGYTFVRSMHSSREDAAGRNRDAWLFGISGRRQHLT